MTDMAVNLIMLGPPGAGKGTQAERFARARGIPRISTGEILRDAVAADSDLGRRVKTIMNRGELVSDAVMGNIVRERLDKSDAQTGFVLDGFPRTVGQAEALDGMMNGRGPLVIVDIVVPEVELVRRLGTRLICASCGTDAPQTHRSQRCERCDGMLVQREDDDQDVVLERLKVYHCQTEPLVEYYRQRPTFRSINGAQPPDKVAADLMSAADEALLAGGGVVR